MADELRDFYERYIETFNRQVPDEFAGFFHLPVTVVHAPRYDTRRAGRELAVVNDASWFTSPMPPRWRRSTIDSVVTLDQVGAFDPRPGLAEGDARRPGIVASVTRWDQADTAYQQVQALYVLTREQDRLGIKVLVELAVADLPT